MSAARARFDWQAIHAELEARLARLGARLDDDGPKVAAILRGRSVQLAARLAPGTGAGGLPRVLLVRLGAERYALPLECAQEVTALSHAATLPGAGAAVVGVVNWRGEFVVVFDLALAIGLAPAEGRRLGHVIVLRGPEPRLAVAVDHVERILALDIGALQAPEQLRSRRAELFRGATADAVVVLDEGRLMTELRQELQAA
jgi:chemotaxis signal transduction protein